MFLSITSFASKGHALYSSITMIILFSLFSSCGDDIPKKNGTEGVVTPTPAPTRAYIWMTTSRYQGDHLALRNKTSSDAECTARAGDATALPVGVNTHKAILAAYEVLTRNL